jgi:hypothetical protein
MVRIPFRSRCSRIALALAVLVVAGATLLQGSGPVTGGWCLLCGEHGTADAIRNVVLFLPVGATALVATGSILLATAIASGISLLAEIAQLGIPGRGASLGDLVFNTLGGVIGAFAARSTAAWLHPRRRTRRRLVVAATAAPLLVVGAAGAVFQTDLPATTYYGQWTPDLGHFDVYGGRVLEARIGDFPIPCGRLIESEDVRQLLSVGEPVAVQAIAGPEPARLAPIFSMYDEYQQEILVLAATRRTLAFRIGTRAARFRLNVPTLSFRGALAGVEVGDSLDISTAADGDGHCLRVAVTGISEPLRRRCGVGYTVASGWQLLAPAGFGSRLPALLDSLWLAILYVPLGYWIRRDALGAVAVIISAIGLLTIPSITPLVGTPAIAFVSSVLGLLAGAGLRGWMSARPGDAAGLRA